MVVLVRLQTVTILKKPVPYSVEFLGRAVYEQITGYFEMHSLWHTNNHGFRPNHSTTTAISQIYDIWISALESKKLTAALLLDLTAAFDVVDHKILLKKLKVYNFSQSA